MEEIEKLKELLSEMKNNNFRGSYKISDKQTTIEWNIQEKICLEIILGGHGGDDLIIIRFEDPKGKKGEIYDELNTNTNEELMKILKEYNDSKFELKEEKGIFGVKYILTVNGK